MRSELIQFFTVSAMSDDLLDGAESSPPPTSRIKSALANQPRWKRLLLTTSAISVVFGFLLLALESDAGDSDLRRSGPGSTPVGGAAFADGVTLPGATQTPAEQGGAWAPVFLRFGFSFFIGFALGSAARTVFKLVLLFMGLFAMFLFGFAELGYVEVHWDRMGEAFDGLVAKIGEEAGTLKGFFTGRLPSAGLAMFGLYAGLKRG